MRKIVQKKFQTIFILIIVIMTILLISFNNEVYQKAQAANVTYESMYSGDTCVLRKGSASISNVSDFDKGKGVSFGGNIIYKSNKKYHCCYEQKMKGNEPKGCDDVQLNFRPDVDPWFATSQGNVYSELASVPVGQPKSGYFKSNGNVAKPSEYTFSSISEINNSNEVSYNNYVITNYKSPSTKPPRLSGFASWYEYMKRLVPLNASLISKSVSNISGSMKSTLGSVEGAFITNNNVKISSGTSCDGRFILFVEKDLVISPSFKLANSDINQKQACLFIVNGKTTVKDDVGGSGGITIDSKKYDLLQIGVISTGELYMEYDKGAGLKVEGFLSGSGGNLQRDIDEENYPSVWTEYDPRYVELFKKELKQLKYSINEKGYNTNYELPE